MTSLELRLVDAAFLKTADPIHAGLAHLHGLAQATEDVRILNLKWDFSTLMGTMVNEAICLSSILQELHAGRVPCVQQRADGLDAQDILYAVGAFIEAGEEDSRAPATKALFRSAVRRISRELGFEPSDGAGVVGLSHEREEAE